MHSLNIYYVAVQSRAKVVILWEQVTQTRIVKMLSVYLPLRRGPHFIARNITARRHRSVRPSTLRSSYMRVIVKNVYYMDAFGISACAHAHTLTRAAADAAANNENCAWQKNYQHGDRVRYIRMNVFRVADPAALLSRLISKSNNVRAADSLRVSPARELYIYIQLKQLYSS